MPQNFSDATEKWLYSTELCEFAQLVWNAAIQACVDTCNEADKSTHPSDLADKLELLIEE